MGEVYEGAKGTAMASHERFRIISMAQNGRLVLIKCAGGQAHLSAEKLQDNIDYGFLVKVN